MTVPGGGMHVRKRRGSKAGTLRGLLLIEAMLGVGLTIILSSVAAGVRNLSPDDIGADVGVRFVAAGAFVLAALAAIAARGVRRRRSWSWTLSALIQLALAIGTGAAVLAADWHPGYLAAFLLAGLVMMVLSTASVRRALGQE